MRSLFVILLIFAATPAYAQSGAGSQDSSGTENLRPRSSGSYVVGCFPSPAKGSQQITVQTYNRDPVVLSVTVYDVLGRAAIALIPKQMTAAGLQTLTIPHYQLAAGVYHVRLVTYTASDASDVVDDASFVIIN